MLYVVARHAPGGLLYLKEDGEWCRCRCGAEEFEDKDFAAELARAFSGGHVRNERRQPLTCNPRGRPRSTVALRH